MQARQQDTVFVSDYGIRPYMKTRPGRLRAVIDDCKGWTPKCLCSKRALRLLAEDAVRKEYFITNTSTEQECPSKVKTIGLFFEEMQGLTVEGNDATLMFHGKMTMIAFAHSKQMKLRNLHIDFERPGGSGNHLHQGRWQRSGSEPAPWFALWNREWKDSFVRWGMVFKPEPLHRVWSRKQALLL